MFIVNFSLSDYGKIHSAQYKNAYFLECLQNATFNCFFGFTIGLSTKIV